MNSKLVGNEEAATQSESFKMQQKRKKESKVRPLYSNATTASNLNDRSARRSLTQLQSQFCKSSRSITPAPGVDTSNWANTNMMLVSASNTGAPPRNSSSKDRNTISAAAAATTNVNILVAKGGEAGAADILRAMLQSGKYDDIVREHVASLDAGNDTDATNVNIQVVESKDIPAFHTAQSKDREIAEGQPSEEDIANDQNSAIQTVNASSMEELEQIAGFVGMVAV